MVHHGNGARRAGPGTGGGVGGHGGGGLAWLNEAPSRRLTHTEAYSTLNTV